MAGEWQEVKLTRVADLMMGQSPPRKTYNEQGTVSRASRALISIYTRLRQY
jgi:hypothetical protein